jgi:hypothetical protein
MHKHRVNTVLVIISIFCMTLSGPLKGMDKKKASFLLTAVFNDSDQDVVIFNGLENGERVGGVPKKIRWVPPKGISLKTDAEFRIPPTLVSATAAEAVTRDELYIRARNSTHEFIVRLIHEPIITRETSVKIWLIKKCLRSRHVIAESEYTPQIIKQDAADCIQYMLSLSFNSKPCSKEFSVDINT